MQRETLKNIGYITIIFILTHGLILVLTGTWWDDKSWAGSPADLMWETSLQLGKPSAYYLMKFIFEMPESWARLIIFLCYYLGAIGFYFLCNQISSLESKSSLVLTFLYIAIPVNDVRAIRSVFPYTLGLFLFIMAFCGLVILKNKFAYQNITLRCGVLFFFFCSFILNSNIVFYVAPLFYILYYIIKEKKLHTVYQFFDFAIIPFAYFLLKQAFFPSYGLYKEYNLVTVNRMYTAIGRTNFACLKALKGIFVNWAEYKCIGILLIIIILLGFGLLFLKNKKMNEVQPHYIPVKERWLFLVTGYILIYLGIYPYIVADAWIGLTGPGGRSAILIGAGAAVIIYAIIIWIPFIWIRATVCAGIVLCGIFHFNTFYLLYQEDYYRQLDLIHELREYKRVLNDKKNILYLTDRETEKIETTRFYSLNSNAKEAFGDQTHFIMKGIRDYAYLDGTATPTMEDFVHGGGDYQMAEYELGRSNDIEAIIFYRHNLSIQDTVFLKFLEITDHTKFENKLYDQHNLTVYIPGMKIFDEILEQELKKYHQL